MPEIAFDPPSLPTAGALILPLAEGGTSPALAAADEATGGAVSRALEAAEFKGKPGQTATVLAPGGGLSRVVAVGLGKPDALTEHTFTEAGGHAASAVAREPQVAVAARLLSPAHAAQFALGMVLRAWRFDRYRTKEKPEDKPRLAHVSVRVEAPDEARAAWAPLEAVARGAAITRELVTEPPNVLTPEVFASRIEVLAELGLDVEVFGPERLAELKFGALLGVAQGSANPPRVAILRWNGALAEAGAEARAPVAFVGKGVTFDSGGISIKPAAGMEEMKYDMAGAGAVVGTMAALAIRRARADAVGIVGLVENMPSGTAQRPGDVVTSASGQTVEIINTDAEGRMVLADLMHYVQERFKPAIMIDLATLTGSIVVALGHEYAGMFSNDDSLAQQLAQAGEATGEKLWRMPLGEAYDKQLKSDIADMKHVAGRPGGSITAAQFLQRFVSGTKWAHLDIAGTVWASKDSPLHAKGATGFGVRLLDRLVADHYEG